MEERRSPTHAVAVLRRHEAGARGTYAPDRAAELSSWLRAIAKDDAKFIVITTQ